MGRDRDGICRSWGQYHFETFDGMYYYFPGKCSYILAKDCRQAEPQYTVWVHNSRDCEDSVYSCPRSLSLHFPNEEEIHIAGYHVHKGGVRLSLPQTIHNVFIERLADYILVKSTFGFSLAWDGSSGVYIKMTEEHKGRACGLCGNYNDDGSDDLTETADFGNSWRVELPRESPCEPVEEDFPGPCRAESDMDDATEKCSALLFFPFLSCHENIDPNPFVASCISDQCVSDEEETFCRSLVEYTRACSHVGYPVREWRDSFPTCADNCEDSFVHRDCISCCPPTCTFEKECLGTNLHCLDGCYCPDGLILQNGTCIAVSQCPCVYHGRAYPLGHVLEQGCSACVCMGGVWNCTENNCTAECSITGHSHITSFDGRIFTHMGTCQYVLAKSRGNSKFVITLQNVPCGERQEHPCIHSVMLVVDEDINRQVTITREGEVLIGINQAANTVEVRQLTSLFIQLRASFGLRVQLDGRGGRLYITLDSSWKGHTMGLCGTFNGNLRDDFLSPSGMIEGTPQLHANAWKVSSACISPVNVPIIDPCDLNQENGYYASLCTVLVEELFAPCHSYVSPSLYYQQCRFQACLCGGSCLCTALAHYAYVCAKHQVVINFRAHVSECGVVCLGGMMYHSCTTTCGRTCHSLSTGELCTSDCAEGCGCSENTFYDDIRQRCVLASHCHCYFMGSVFQPGEVSFSASEPERRDCPPGMVYYSCREQHGGLSRLGLACEVTCRNLMMNFSCSPMTPCIPGCGCPAGHNGECYFPENCPCSWLGLEYLPGQVVSTPCYTCVCHRGFFNCTYYPCPAVCTVYSDRHYHTFDGLEYDYVSNCQVYLVKSINETEISITTQNKDCYESGIICMKYLVVYVGLTKIYFSDSSGKPGYEFELWRAGYYTVVHFPKQEITVLWDKKTTVHIRAGPRWKDQLTGMCGNFDMVTINDMTTSSHMEVSNAQAFGDSWALGQCESDFVVQRPCEGDLNRQPYAKRECALLYSDVFSPCHNVVDVTWFYKNCLTDTCNCNRGGDCECLCTSIAAYAHKCCQQGVTIHWRSPTVCSVTCLLWAYCCVSELGEGPYVLLNAALNETVVGANLTSGEVFPLPRIGAQSGILFNFMVTAGLFKDKFSRVPAVSLESAERPNYFLCVSVGFSVRLERWTSTEDFRQRATFIHHQGLWLPGHSSFELQGQKGVFLTLGRGGVSVQAYDHSERFKHISSFSSFLIPYRIMCEWKYQACASPCLRTCSDPSATRCRFLPPVEGCFPRCPRNMILDEITRRCVYREDCDAEPSPTTTTQATTAFPTTPPITPTTSVAPISTTLFTTPSPPQTMETSTPPFSHRVDECSEYICFNGQLMLHNASLHCRFNVTQPNCGLLGMAVQTNRDVCCPQWECPCRCSVISDLRVITFDGNNVALYDNGSYILVHLPRENIVGHIEKCPTSGTSGLCFKKLNITTHSYRIMINRLERKVSINFINARLPFTRQNLHIDDTGTMYVIRTPGGVSIQWYHSTGIMVLQYNAPSNATSRTRGLCGCCDGNPADDLKLPNGTVVRDVQDIPVFLQSWMVDTSEETDYFRRVGDNCTTGNCTKCFQMLNRSPFSECHKKVSPEQFCDKIWAGDLHYKDNECDFLAAYVAICYTHNICINWRTHDFCPLKCPPGKEYQPCVNTCQTKTCQNREYYEESTCSSIREECVCKSGTILHRADSAFCVTEDQCVCTDNEGAPRAPGEVWNGSDRGCCLYRCLENGSIVAVEPDCSELPAPLCEREGEYVVDILEEGACCPKKICGRCNLTICESEAPTCENGNRLVIGYSTLSCCPEYRCECDPQACPSVLMPECREDQFLVEVRMEKSCCYSFLCVCESCIDPIPVCKDGEILAVDLNTTDRCCPQYHCGNTPLAFIVSFTSLMHNLSTHVLAEKAPVCLFQGVTVLSPGQSMVQYFEGDLCYTVHCLHEKDPETGYYAMDVSTVNCSEKCGPHQIYIPSSDPHVCCGSCKNVSCPHTSENGTTEVYMAGSSWVTNCTRYDCMETPVGAVILGSLVVCPPFNETECLQNGGVVQSYIDGCCRTCKCPGGQGLIFTVILLLAQITVYSCDGKCPSATIFNFNINSHARFCKCCRENGLQSRTVQLYCTRNSTVVNYTFQEPMECSCQWN
uniref:Otogelin like n=1 Tax=Scleropages formosus TaxID=113540 RepID=A0A8C9TD73_SCLFO